MNTQDDASIDERARDKPRTIGQLLVEAGILDRPSAERIASLQSELGLPFGQVAIQLALVRPADLDIALSRQFRNRVAAMDAEALSPDIAILSEPMGALAEQMRSLRAHCLAYFAQKAPPRRIAVLGWEAGAGRSLVVANLAVAFAQLGTRTLLIDADLRQPSLHRLFGKSRDGWGLSNLLNDQCGLECAHSVQAFPGLRLLTAGSPAPNPQELLCRSGLAELLESAAPAYDVVLLDTAGLARTADARIVAAAAGAAIVVARQGRTPMHGLLHGISPIRADGVHIVCGVLNHA